jgi:hypothetical protein
MTKLAVFVACRAEAEPRAGDRRSSPPQAADAGTSAAAGAGGLRAFACPGAAAKAALGSISAVRAQGCWRT